MNVAGTDLGRYVRRRAIWKRYAASKLFSGSFRSRIVPLDRARLTAERLARLGSNLSLRARSHIAAYASQRAE